MFIQPCFIRKNTKYLIDKLEELGYNYAKNGAGAWFIPLCELRFLGVNLYSNGYYMGINGAWDSDWIDCGTNEDLFLAIAALNDNGNYMQWFTDSKNWYQNKTNDIEIIRFGPGDPIGYHKATVKELVEHFK